MTSYVILRKDNTNRLLQKCNDLFLLEIILIEPEAKTKVSQHEENPVSILW